MARDMVEMVTTKAKKSLSSVTSLEDNGVQTMTAPRAIWRIG